jgi:hypothetical protein
VDHHQLLLLDHLRLGPKPGHELVALLTDAGLTPKQIRSLRERMGVRVQRSSSGHCTWQLPIAGGPHALPHAPPSAPVVPPLAKSTSSGRAVLNRKSSERFGSKASGPSVPPCPVPPRVATPSVGKPVAPRLPGALPTVPTAAAVGVRDPAGEAARSARRVAFLVGRGLPEDQATKVAAALLSRDNATGPTSLMMGSCAECQAAGSSTCKVEQPWLSMHGCPSRRSIAP